MGEGDSRIFVGKPLTESEGHVDAVVLYEIEWSGWMLGSSYFGGR